MSREIKDSLLYDFSYNIFLVKSLLPINIKSTQEKENIVRWIRLLQSSDKSVEQMKLRNTYTYHLALDIQSGALRAPFDRPPPQGARLSSKEFLQYNSECHPEEESFSSAARQARKSKLERRSPRGSEFLANQPLPDVGAFCYLAVVSKKTQQQ